MLTGHAARLSASLQLEGVHVEPGEVALTGAASALNRLSALLLIQEPSSL